MSAARSKSGEYNVFVINLHPESSEDDVIDMFSEYGKLGAVSLPRNKRTGLLDGFGIFAFKHHDDAASAIDGVNGRTLLGSELQVDWMALDGPCRPEFQRGRGGARSRRR